MEKVIIFGIGDISQIAYLYLSENKNYEIVAFTIDKEYIKEDTFLGLPVVAFENLEDEEFVEYINEIIKDFPEYDFKALYFDKNSIKEIKNKFKENINLEFLKLNTIKDIFINLQVLLGNFSKNKVEISLAHFIILNSDNLACISLNLHLNKSITIKQFSESIRNHYHNFFENIELFGYTKKDIEIYGKDLIKIMIQNAIDRYNIKIEIDMQSSIRKLLFITLYIGLKNNDYFKIINIDRLNTKLLHNKL